jgi:2-polyprenyl-3-methyl-5-hydroxy-6-metoxy-1,4-benzoquinol methylase
MTNQSYFTHERPEVLALIDRPVATALDIGCGAAHFSAAVKRQTGARVWGIEPTAAAAREARTRIDEVLEGTYEQVESRLPEDAFDAIFFNDVLEHMVEPWTMLRKALVPLRADGRVYASIPNVLFADSLFPVLRSRDWRYTDAGILDVTHVRFFTRKSILRLFDEAGYQVERIVPLNVLDSWKWRLLDKVTFGFVADFLPMQYGVVACRKR